MKPIRHSSTARLHPFRISHGKEIGLCRILPRSRGRRFQHTLSFDRCRFFRRCHVFHRRQKVILRNVSLTNPLQYSPRTPELVADRYYASVRDRPSDVMVDLKRIFDSEEISLTNLVLRQACKHIFRVWNQPEDQRTLSTSVVFAPVHPLTCFVKIPPGVRNESTSCVHAKPRIGTWPPCWAK